MCAIFGCVVYQARGDIDSWLGKVLTKMAVSGEDRGRDGTGLAVVYPDGKHHLFRSEKTASDCKGEIRDFLAGKLSQPCIVIANNRYQPLPQPDGEDPEARQPVRAADCFGVHNGTFPDDDLLFKKYGFTHVSGIDSEILLHLYRKYVSEFPKPDTEHRVSAIQMALSEISGGFAYGLIDLEDPCRLHLLRNFKPLTLARYVDDYCEALFFNSERRHLESGFGILGIRNSVCDLFNDRLRFQEMSTYSGVSLNCLKSDFHSVESQWEAKNLLPCPLPITDKGRVEKALVICSGGMDSALAAAVARKVDGYAVTLLHVDYACKARKREAEAVEEVAKALDCKVMFADVTQLGQWHNQSPLMGSEVPMGMRCAESAICWVAARNLVILSMAAAYAEAQGFQYIYSGFNLEESGSFPDNTVEFFKRFESCCELGTLTHVKVKLSVARLMKSSIVRLSHHLGVPMDKTWSCYLEGFPNDSSLEAPKETDKRAFVACGNCGSCWNRRFGYLRAGLEDPQAYRYAMDAEGVPEWYRKGTFKKDITPISQILEQLKQGNSVF